MVLSLKAKDLKKKLQQTLEQEEGKQCFKKNCWNQFLHTGHWAMSHGHAKFLFSKICLYHISRVSCPLDILFRLLLDSAGYNQKPGSSIYNYLQLPLCAGIGSYSGSYCWCWYCQGDNYLDLYCPPLSINPPSLIQYAQSKLVFNLGGEFLQQGSF